MGIIAWIFLGLFSGLLASRLILGTRAPGLAFNCAIGIAGALIGGWTAASLFRTQPVNAYLNLSSWLTALSGAGIVLLGYYLLTRSADEPGEPGPRIPATVPVRPPTTPP